MKILIVEDDPDTAALIAEWVKRIAREIIVARTMEECLAQIERQTPKPQIIILDLKLPDSTVMETLEKISSIRDKTPDSFIVILSGAVSRIDPISKRADGFIHKTDVRDANGFCAKLCDIAHSIFGDGSTFERNLCVLEDAAKRIRTALVK